MKRIVAGSVITLIVLILIAVGIYYSRKYAVVPVNLFRAVPADAAFIIEGQSAAQINSLLKDKKFYSELESDSIMMKATNNLAFIDSIANKNDFAVKIWNNQHVLISAHPTQALDFDFLFIFSVPSGSSTSEAKNTIKQLTGAGWLESQHVYEKKTIFELSKNNLTISFAYSGGLLIISRTTFLVESAIRQISQSSSFFSSNNYKKVKLDKTKNEVNLYLNFMGLRDLLSSYIDPSNSNILSTIGTLSGWAGLKTSLTDNTINFEGSSAASDSTNIFPAFSKLKPVKDEIASAISERTAFYLHFSADNIPLLIDRLTTNSQFYSDKIKREKTIDSLSRKYGFPLDDLVYSWIDGNYTLVITEPAGTAIENNIYACIKINPGVSTLKTIEKLVRSSNGEMSKYAGYTFGKIGIDNFTSLFFGNFFQPIHSTYFIIIQNHIIIAGQPSSIKNFADDFTDKKTLQNSDDYKNDLLLNGNMNLYFNFSKAKNLLRSLGNNVLLNSMSKSETAWNLMSDFKLSVSSQDDKFNLLSRIKFSAEVKDKTALLWSAQLDTTLWLNPITVKSEKENYIVTQDDNNVIYLFDENGTLKWKKQIENPIISNVFAVDYYRNNGTQLLFNTVDKLFLLDLEGNATGNYPIKLPATATNGCSLLNLGGEKQLRIMISCANGITYSYQLSGKPSTEWLFNHFIFNITQPIKQIQYKNRNVFAICDGSGKLILTDSTGKIIPFKTEAINQNYITAEGDSIIGNKILFIDESGILKSISLNTPGASIAIQEEKRFLSIVKNGIGKDERYYLNSTDSVYVMNNDLIIQNAVYIKSDSNTILSADANGIYSGIGNKENNKFYLFQSDGNVYPGFPVKGNRGNSIIPSNSKSEGNKLILADEDGMLYVYSF